MGLLGAARRVLSEVLRKRWWVWNVIVVLAVVGMANLSAWQLRRLDARQELNSSIKAGLQEPPIDASGLAALLADDPTGATAEWRVVTVSGSWRTDEQVLIRNRSFKGLPGYHVATALDLGDGSFIAVNRGFAALDTPASLIEPPPGATTITGVVRLSQQRGWIGPQDPATGELTKMARFDVDRLTRQWDPTLIAGVYLEQVPSDSASGRTQPEAIGTLTPELSEGSHLNYAVQWAAFVLIALIAYTTLLHRSARKRGDNAVREHNPSGR